MDITYITTVPVNIPKRLESQLIVEAGHDDEKFVLSNHPYL